MSRKLLALALGIPALVILVGAIGQLVLPPLTAGRMEDRLTEGGGSATVSTEAFPAARLLFGDGDRIEVRGSGLDLELAEESDAFERLDEFDDVDVRLDSSRAGPLEVDSFELSRSGSAPYRLASAARTTAQDLVGFGADRLDLPGSLLLGYLGGRLPRANREIPIHLDMELRSEDGRVVVISGGGSVAGFPTGPLAQLLTEAIVVRL